MTADPIALRVLILLLLALLAGCGRTPDPPARVAVSEPATANNQAELASDASSVPQKADAGDKLPQPASSAVDVEPLASESANDSTEEDSPEEGPSEEGERGLSSAESEAVGATAATAVAAERIMLLTEAGPLLVDLLISVDGKPYREAFHDGLEEVLEIADADEDGIVTWEEIMSHPRFREGQFGNPATTTYQAQQDMIRLYDSTTNGRVDPDELVRYLTANQGTAQPLSLLTSNSQRSYNRDKSPVREWLDVNEDLILDPAEIDSAPSRLRLRDADDDEILTATDFVDAAELQPGMMTRRPPKIIGPPKAGWIIREEEPWNEMLAGWETLYSLGSPVTSEDLLLGKRLFDELNIDHDAVISAYEMEMLTEVEPHMAFEIELGTGNEANPVSVSLTALRLPLEKTEGVIQHQPNRVTVRLPDTSLDVFATDALGYQRFDEQATNLLQQADGDKNGYLSEDEFSAIQPFVNLEFSGADLNGDGMLLPEEIVTLLTQRTIARRSQLSVKADDQEDALWQSLDSNTDGRIDSREIADAAHALRKLDHDGDGEVQLHELRGSLMIGVVRGGNGIGQPNDPSFRVPTVVRSASDSTPRWFMGMDRNRDQGVSWREFLGDRVQFEQLDVDGDGFVEVEEAGEISSSE